MPNASCSSDLPAYSCAPTVPLKHNQSLLGKIKFKKSQEKLDGVKSVIIYFNTLKYHNNLQHPRAFLPLCFVGVGGRCCSDILFSGPRVRGPLGSFKLQLFHKQLLSVRSLSACWRMRHWVTVWNCGCGLNSILASKDWCSGWNAETIARVKTHLLLSVMFDFNDKLWKHYPRNA